MATTAPNIYEKPAGFFQRHAKAVNLSIQMLLIGLFMYSATAKLLDYDETRQQMLNQVFSKTIALVLIWAVPISEVLTCILIYFNSTRLAGLYTYLIMMCCFTFYIILVMNNYFGRIPCSCGGAIDSLSWTEHLLLNSTFILLAILSILLTKSERRSTGIE